MAALTIVSTGVCPLAGRVPATLCRGEKEMVNMCPLLNIGVNFWSVMRMK